MAKAKAAPVEAKGNVNTINRKRRNSFMRKCLTKANKRLFKSSQHSLFKALVAIGA